MACIFPASSNLACPALSVSAPVRSRISFTIPLPARQMPAISTNAPASAILFFQNLFRKLSPAIPERHAKYMARKSVPANSPHLFRKNPIPYPAIQIVQTTRSIPVLFFFTRTKSNIPRSTARRTAASTLPAFPCTG